MKKNNLLIMSILLLLVSFATEWYGDHLFSRLFVFAFPIYIILPTCFVVLLVMSIRRIATRKEYTNFFSITVLALLVILIMYFPFRRAKVNYELTRFEPDRLKIVEMIQNNQLPPKDNLGNVDLPVGYGKLSSDGEVFVHQNDANGQVIGFWIFRGMLSGSVELIYSTGGEALIRATQSGHPITKIEKLKENWYYVEMDY